MCACLSIRVDGVIFLVLQEAGPNHLITGDIEEMPENVRRYSAVLRGRVMLVEKLKMCAVESVVRGYITGGGFKEYKEKGNKWRG